MVCFICHLLLYVTHPITASHHMDTEYIGDRIIGAYKALECPPLCPPSYEFMIA